MQSAQQRGKLRHGAVLHFPPPQSKQLEAQQQQRGKWQLPALAARPSLLPEEKI